MIDRFPVHNKNGILLGCIDHWPIGHPEFTLTLGGFQTQIPIDEYRVNWIAANLPRCPFTGRRCCKIKPCCFNLSFCYLEKEIES